jgi:murein DD-endopeptidase MepM/ murein hydrolase activator NlpD
MALTGGIDLRRHAPLGRARPKFASTSLRSRPHAYAGRVGALLPEIYANDHAEGRRAGRFRWVLSTCLAAAVGALAILVAVAGSMDSDDGDITSFEQRLQQAAMALRLPSGHVDGLHWAVPKTDKLVIPTGAIALKAYIPEPVKQRRGQREYTFNKYYLRLAARLGPISKQQAATVPPFNPFTLYNNAAPIGGADRPDAAQEPTAPTKLIELNGALPNEDGQEIDTQEVTALVARAQAAEDDAKASAAELLASRAERDASTLPPETTVLPKTVFDAEPNEDLDEEEAAPAKGLVRKAALGNVGAIQNNSLYASFYALAAKQGIPADLIMQVMRINAPQTDFRQRVRVGDAVELFFDLKGEDRGIDGEVGDLLATFITAGGTTHKFYRFRSSDGVVDFYDTDGNTARKFLMRVPVRGADVRLTSGYGLRMHPLLHIAKMHAGEDWACAFGTPIMAAGDGAIVEAGPKGENGNYIRILHANGYETGYAHMSRFATGVHVGVRVRQGQVIGYVGSTGLSSGPHVHFEVWIKNQGDNGFHHVNPGTIPASNERQLKGKDLANFKRERARIDDLMRRHPVRSTQLPS